MNKTMKTFVIIFGLLLIIAVFYFSLSEKYKYDYRVGLVFGFIGFIICSSVIIAECRYLSKRFQPKDKDK
ncbi:MAG: hypothetical protein IJT38_05135 [Clostridia bacterium]|nr:hypothetical protein [Clostridia bacterium]